MASPQEPQVETAGPLRRLLRQVSGLGRRALDEADRPGRATWLYVALLAVIEFGWRGGTESVHISLAYDALHLGLMSVASLSTWATLVSPARTLRGRGGVDLLFFMASLLLLAVASLRAAGLVVILRTVMVSTLQVTHRSGGARVLHWLMARPASALVVSFLGTIFAGTVLLLTPSATAEHVVKFPLVALFTATSAVCVTGLTVVDPGTYYSRFGQWVILILIQVGGLGIITLTSGVAVMMRERLAGRAGVAVQEMLEARNAGELRGLLVTIVASTVLCEGLGAVGLFPAMTVDPSGAPLLGPDRVFYAVFHSVSAYCNAGFALYADGFVRFSSSWLVNGVTMALIFLGGLGASVFMDLVRAPWRHGPRHAWDFLSVHTRLVLTTSTALVLVGAAALCVLEGGHGWRDRRWDEVLLIGLFQSVSLRTAGFATVDLATLGPPALLVCLFLMLVGGSPGGMAGGVKTTSLAVILLAVRAAIRGRPRAEVFGRTIPTGQVHRAITVVTLSLGLLWALTVLLMLAEPAVPFLALAFEAVSAFATVGYTLNLTPTLSDGGQTVLVAMMFMGRLGPFTLALALGGTRRAAPVEYPEGRVQVG
ncbi:MAG: hypothetical protein HY904_25280 [Deltaproteobacteria bacterium]|nr:hypothetical protein [Deltaproteobacteria bacterium]